MDIPVWEHYTLTIEEASRYFRIGENKLRKLVATDRVPKGKRDCVSLREKEAEIRKDIEDGIDAVGKKMTLCQLYAKQNAQRGNVKKSTQKQREQLMEILKADKLGARSDVVS